MESIFTTTTYTRQLKISISGQSIPDDDVLTLDLVNSFFNFGLRGTLTFKDSYALLNSKEVTFDGSVTVDIIVFDFMQNRRKFHFVVQDMQVQDAARVNVVVLSLIDPFAYKLANLYVPKSFNSNITSAFSEIVQNYNLDRELQKNNLSLDLGSAGETRNFVINSGESVYTFFEREFRRANVRMWQDLEQVHVKEFRLSSAKVNDKPYKVNCTNNNYLFKIHEYKKSDVSKNKVYNFSPVQVVTRFRNKEVIQDTVNLSDFYQDLLLNGNDIFKSLQGDAVGKSFSTFNDTTEAQKYDLFNTFINNEQMDIVVPGTLVENQPGVVIDVVVPDKTQYIEANQIGNRTSSGKWFIKVVQSKFVGGKFIQRLRLGRFDHPRV